MQVDVYGVNPEEITGIEAGLVTWWTLKGSTDLDDLCSEWENAGLDESFKPSAIGAGTALWKAVNGGKFSKHSCLYNDDGLIVRKLPKERSAWAIVRERIRGKRMDAELSYETLMKVWLDEDLHPVFFRPTHIQLDMALFSDYQSYENWFDSAAREVETRFHDNLGSLDARDMSNWLINVLQNCIAGIRLRQRGGIYYVPPDRTVLWQEIIEIINTVSADHTIYTMPVVKSAQVTQAVLDSLAAEVNACVEKISEDLGAGIQNRAITNRKSRALALDEKLAAYKSLLGSGLVVLETKVEDLRASLTELELMNDCE
jgi:hypothetical protein